MLDIKFIRDNPELIKEAARKKRLPFNVEELTAIDDKRRILLMSIEKKRAEQNAFSNLISSLKDENEKSVKLLEMKNLKADLGKEEEELKTVMRVWQKLMVAVPNIPDISVPEGENDNNNKEVKTWGEKPSFDFTPKSHIELMSALDMLDLERGVKIAGFRGYVLKNDAVLLNFALWQYGLSFFMKKGFTPLLTPAKVKREILIGSGYLPQGEEDLYKTQDGEYLAGTAEVPTMGYYMDEVLPREKMPFKFLSFSPCFRREAGSHGKDTKGIMRVHEFFKLEQVVLCEANHEESVKWHEWLNRNMEEFIESFDIPYRTVINCGADLGLGQVKKYDVELWVPSEHRYREISSTSYFNDFQTRRLNIRYKDAEEKLRFAHSLNSTALPTPRILIALLENNQQPDGSVKVPEVLVSYLGKPFIK